METMEIVILAIGIVLFFASFFIGEKKYDEPGESSIGEDEIRQLVQDEYERTKNKLGDITEETVTYSMEKAERALDKITNEKMLALGEYSDTIMNQINSSHQEVVFLSDMLTNNKNDLTVLLGQAKTDARVAMDTANEAIEKAGAALEKSGEASTKSSEALSNSSIAEEKMISARKIIHSEEISDNPNETIKEGIVSREIKEEPEKTVRKRSSRKKKTEPEPDETFGTQISLTFDGNSDGSDNNNEKILNLHKMGKSNVAIAKELGLGVGEVKLVIDLFK